MPSELSGEGLHRFQPRMHHPRTQCLDTGLRLRAVDAVGVDALQAFAHPARPGSLRPPLRQIALDLQMRVREVGLVPGPQVLRAFERRVLPGLGLADLVDGLVGVFDNMELVDDSGRVGQVVADALGESQAHVARHQAHAVWVAVVRHEIVREPFHRGRVLARHHADHVALRQVGDDGDVPVAPAAGLVDADRLHARVVLVQACLIHVMADEPPQSRVVLTDPFGEHDTGWLFASSTTIASNRSEPAARTRPRHRHGPHAVLRARHPWYGGVDERLVLEEIQVTPCAFHRVMYRASHLPASRLGTVETGAGPVSNRDVRLPAHPRRYRGTPHR